MNTYSEELAKQVLLSLRNVYAPATLRRDKTGEVFSDDVEASVNDFNVASLKSPHRPFKGDVISQGDNEWTVTDVGGWADANLWTLEVTDTQPSATGEIAAPTITFRRDAGQLRIYFPDGQSGDEVFARVMMVNGQIAGPEWRHKLTAADKQMVVQGVQDGYSVSVWFRRRPNRASARTVMEVPTS